MTPPQAWKYRNDYLKDMEKKEDKGTPDLVNVLTGKLFKYF
jgi:hypothetical protein